MGEELCEHYDIARTLFEQADQALGFSLSSICFEGPADRLTLTEIAQPAILTVSVACYRLAMANPSTAQNVVVAAGHSLGEYSALVAAGSLSFEDAVVLVHKRGKYMQEAVPVGTGKMIAVLGKELSEIESALGHVAAGEVAEVANVNAPGQVVIAGSIAGVNSFVTQLGTSKVIELAVSAPFHCSLMKPAEERLRVDLAKIEINLPSFPVVQNFTGQIAKDFEEIRENLAKQVCGRVRWVECVELGTTDFKPSAVWEYGAGNVLTGLARRIVPDLPRVNIDSPAALKD
jgi:[acyl-carrier-protein] S-malonyltransferase